MIPINYTIAMISAMITVTKVIVAFMFKLLSRTGVCSKSGLPALRIVIGRYGYKSSFGAKNDRPGDDCTLRSV